MESPRQTSNGPASSGEVIALDQRSRRRVGEDDSSGPIRVLVADGEALVRAGLRGVLEAGGGIAVVAEAATGDEAVELAVRHRPDVTVIDKRVPGLDALEAGRRIRAASELDHARLLLLIGRDADSDPLASLRAGATGVLIKDSDAADLRRAIHVVAGGGGQLSPSFTRLLIDEFAHRPDPQLPAPEELDELTARELEVLTLVATGLTNGEIAERLVVSPATAKTHVSRAMVKLRVHDRAKLVTIAYEAGIVQARAGRPDLRMTASGPARSLAAA